MLLLPTVLYCIQRLKNIFSDSTCVFIEDSSRLCQALIYYRSRDRRWMLEILSSTIWSRALVQSTRPSYCFAFPFFSAVAKNLWCEDVMHPPCPVPIRGGASNLKFSTICCREEKLESPCPTFQTFPTFENIEGRMLLLVIGSSDATKLL